jgi:hypothetical protein
MKKYLKDRILTYIGKMETYEIYELLKHEINSGNEELLDQLNTECKYLALDKLNYFCSGGIRELYDSLNDKQIYPI